MPNTHTTQSWSTQPPLTNALACLYSDDGNVVHTYKESGTWSKRDSPFFSSRKKPHERDEDGEQRRRRKHEKGEFREPLYTLCGMLRGGSAQPFDSVAASTGIISADGKRAHTIRTVLRLPPCVATPQG